MENKSKLSKNVKFLGLVSFFNDFASEMVYPIVPGFRGAGVAGGIDRRHCGIYRQPAQGFFRLAVRPGTKKKDFCCLWVLMLNHLQTNHRHSPGLAAGAARQVYRSFRQGDPDISQRCADCGKFNAGKYGPGIRVSPRPGYCRGCFGAAGGNSLDKLL
jgi:hypothetical protein